VQFQLLCTNPENFNPGGRPKLPTEIREIYQARSQEALEVLTRWLQSDDDRIAMMAAQAILERAYGSRRNRSTPISLRLAVRFAITPKCLRRLRARRLGWSR
jgi:hypothetical protein